MIEKFDGFKHYPTTLLDEFKDHPKIKALLSKTGLTAFDLGCGVPQFLLWLYHERLAFDNFCGVDCSYFVGKLANDVETKNVYEYYSYWLSLQVPEFTQDRGKLSEEDFKKHFHFYFGWYIDIFLREFKLSCEYLILSNTIHLNGEETIELFNECEARLNPGGIIYVRVNHEDNPSSTNHNHYKFNEENFLQLFENKYQQLYFNTLRYFDEDRKDTLLYFGIKK